jgi:hypothetical protein
MTTDYCSRVCHYLHLPPPRIPDPIPMWICCHQTLSAEGVFVTHRSVDSLRTLPDLGLDSEGSGVMVTFTFMLTPTGWVCLQGG